MPLIIGSLLTRRPRALRAARRSPSLSRVPLLRRQRRFLVFTSRLFSSPLYSTQLLFFARGSYTALSTLSPLFSSPLFSSPLVAVSRFDPLSSSLYSTVHTSGRRFSQSQSQSHVQTVLIRVRLSEPQPAILSSAHASTNYLRPELSRYSLSGPDDWARQPAPPF